MLRNIKAILLDIDGTVFSSEEIIGRTYQKEFSHFIEEHGLSIPIPDLPFIMEQIGKPIVEIFRNLAPGIDSSMQLVLSENILHSLVASIDAGEGHYYEKVSEVTSELHRRGYQLFGASNGRYPYIDAILRYMKVRDLFTDVPVVNNENIHNKTELVSWILSAYGLKPEEALMVGDRYSDRDAGVHNGCPFAACRYGHGNEAEWEGATLYLDSYSDLLKHLP